MRVLYLTFAENIFDNAIFESQVKTLLFWIKKKYEHKVNLCLIATIPVFYISRKGITFNLSKYKKNIDFLQNEFKEHKIKLKIVPIYFPFLKSWGIHLNYFVLLIVFFFTFPILLQNLNKFKPNIIHCRSYPATVFGIFIKRFININIRIIFDMRGLFPEEGIIHNRWKENSMSYNFWKKLEYKSLNDSDKIIVISDTFKDYILSLLQNSINKVEIITAGVDTKLLKPKTNSKFCVHDRFDLHKKRIFLYHGSMNSWHNPALLAIVFKKIREQLANAYLMVLTNYDHCKLKRIFLSKGILPGDFSIRWVRYSEIPASLSIADYAIIPSTFLRKNNEIFVKKIFDTMIGLKVSECLAAGLPIIANENIGGLKRILLEHDLGMTFNSNPINLNLKGIQQLESKYDSIHKRCIKFAKQYLNIEKNAAHYLKIYNSLIER